MDRRNSKFWYLDSSKSYITSCKKSLAKRLCVHFYFLKNTVGENDILRIKLCKIFPPLCLLQNVLKLWSTFTRYVRRTAFTRLAFLHLSKHEKFVAFQKVISTLSSSSKCKIPWWVCQRNDLQCSCPSSWILPSIETLQWGCIWRWICRNDGRCFDPKS